LTAIAFDQYSTEIGGRYVSYFDMMGILLVATVLTIAINDNFNVGGQYIDE